MIDVPVRVKDALRDGRLKKNYRFVVLNDDGSADFTIDNNTLVSESVKFDERMCSGDTLKFGLCEGSSLEFQYFDHPNINGRRIQSFIDVEYMEPSIDIVETEEGTWHPTRVTKSGSYTFKSKNNVSCEIGINAGGTSTYYELDSENDYQISLDLTTANTFWVETFNVTVTVTTSSGFSEWHTIPMGYFTVEKCPRQASTGIFKVTAYNKLQAQYLDAKANDKIIKIINEGVWGASNSADVGTILDTLLTGYSISRKEESVDFTYSVTVPATSTSYLRQTDMSGSYNGSYLHELSLTYFLSPQYFSSSNFYKFVINCKKIYDASYSYVPSYLVDEWYKVSGTIDRLYNWLKGDHQAYQAGGALVIDTSGGQKSIAAYGDNMGLDNVSSPFVTNIQSGGIAITFSGFYVEDSSTSHTWTAQEKEIAQARAEEILFNQKNITIDISAKTEIEKTRLSSSAAENLPDVTLRQLQAAVFEINAQYGQIDRVTDLFEGVELNQSRLYPANSLYPANNLYPGGQGMRGDASTYSKLWTDNQGVQQFRYLIITYKGLDANNKATDMTLQRTINANGNVDYNMSDNWLFKNLVWSASDVGDYADAMVSKLTDVSWFPFEMWAAGLPYLETGDEIEITNDEGTYPSYILQRQLQGIQNLQDTFINGTLDVF